jgi:hypothetical protein
MKEEAKAEIATILSSTNGPDTSLIEAEALPTETENEVRT